MCDRNLLFVLLIWTTWYEATGLVVTSLQANNSYLLLNTSGLDYQALEVNTTIRHSHRCICLDLISCIWFVCRGRYGLDLDVFSTWNCQWIMWCYLECNTTSYNWDVLSYTTLICIIHMIIAACYGEQHIGCIRRKSWTELQHHPTGEEQLVPCHKWLPPGPGEQQDQLHWLLHVVGSAGDDYLSSRSPAFFVCLDAFYTGIDTSHLCFWTPLMRRLSVTVLGYQLNCPSTTSLKIGLHVVWDQF